ncbi:MAG: SMC-Scp complex subunit ScpB [Candidatus Zixiibacteriota bacterium]|nr:MAG: SMC-Scp complex subunit ScpB [candidate division Zixibacteria bacterium]
MMDKAYIDSTIEAMILASPEPIPARRISKVVGEASPSRVASAVTELNNRYAETGSSFRIREISGGYQHYILPEYVDFVQELLSRRRRLRLTRAALETIAIVAYRQPVTKSEIEHVRGVATDSVVQNLLEKGMIRITGRARTVGRPLQYGTSDEFLKFFGLNSLGDLPKMTEIEELIAAQEARSQTELELSALPVADGLEKLNVADGTFDPERRRRIAEGAEDVDKEPDGDPAEATTAASVSTSHKMVLKKAASTETEQVAVEQEHTVPDEHGGSTD